MSKREAKWNELKGELNNLVDVTPIPNLIDEATYHHHLIAYELTFFEFKVDDVLLNTSNNLKDNSIVKQRSLNNILFQTPIAIWAYELNLIPQKVNYYFSIHDCHNPSLGLTTKARVYKVVGQKGSRESHNIFLGV